MAHASEGELEALPVDGEKDGPVTFEYEGTPWGVAAATEALKRGARATALVEFVKLSGTAKTAEIIGHLMTTFGVAEITAKRDLRDAVKARRVSPAAEGVRGVYKVPV